MGRVIITLKIMPSDLSVNLDEVSAQAERMISEFGGAVGKREIEPVAFGLKAIKIIFILDEKVGGTDVLEQKISSIPGVESVNVVDVRRAIG
ncbi:MAG: elongation factor 1-beta [Candidatus Woesearchaeota archaeon]